MALQKQPSAALDVPPCDSPSPRQQAICIQNRRTHPGSPSARDPRDHQHAGERRPERPQVSGAAYPQRAARDRGRATRLRSGSRSPPSSARVRAGASARRRSRPGPGCESGAGLAAVGDGGVDPVPGLPDLRAGQAGDPQAQRPIAGRGAGVRQVTLDAGDRREARIFSTCTPPGRPRVTDLAAVEAARRHRNTGPELVALPGAPGRTVACGRAGRTSAAHPHGPARAGSRAGA